MTVELVTVNHGNCDCGQLDQLLPQGCCPRHRTPSPLSLTGCNESPPVNAWILLRSRLEPRMSQRLELVIRYTIQMVSFQLQRLSMFDKMFTEGALGNYISQCVNVASIKTTCLFCTNSLECSRATDMRYLAHMSLSVSAFLLYICGSGGSGCSALLSKLLCEPIDDHSLDTTTATIATNTTELHKEVETSFVPAACCPTNSFTPLLLSSSSTRTVVPYMPIPHTHLELWLNWAVLNPNAPANSVATEHSPTTIDANMTPLLSMLATEAPIRIGCAIVVCQNGLSNQFFLYIANIPILRLLRALLPRYACLRLSRCAAAGLLQYCLQSEQQSLVCQLQLMFKNRNNKQTY